MKKVAKIRKNEKIREIKSYHEKKKRITKFIHLRNEVENTIVRTIK